MADYSAEKSVKNGRNQTVSLDSSEDNMKSDKGFI